VTRLVLLLALAGGTAAAVAAHAPADGVRAPAAPAPAGAPLGIFASRPPLLARLDPRTLVPLRPRLRLGADTAGWSFSPDRRRLALWSGREIRIVDVLRLRLVRLLRGLPPADALAWLAPRRLVAVGYDGSYVVDPTTGRVVEELELGGQPRHVEHAGDSLVVLVAAPGRIGPARVVVLSADGPPRSATLDRIAAGTKGEGDDFELASPGLAVDPDGRRAFVAGIGTVAAVDLDSLAVRYRSLDPPSLAGRLLRWLSPSAHAKGPVSGPVREALWLGDGLLALSGYDGAVERDGQVVRHRVTPAGLKLVDTRDWEVRTLDERAMSFSYAAGTLLAYAHDGTVEEPRGIGLVGYGLDGRRRFELFEGRELVLAPTHGKRAYVWGGDATKAVDVERGVVERNLWASVPTLLTGRSQRW
jgi:hypothetical protein